MSRLQADNNAAAVRAGWKMGDQVGECRRGVKGNSVDG